MDSLTLIAFIYTWGGTKGSYLVEDNGRADRGALG